jgi:DNA-binding transcriptional regulator YiaG
MNSCGTLGFPFNPAVLALDALEHPIRCTEPQGHSTNMLRRDTKLPRQGAVIDLARKEGAYLPLYRAKMGVQIETSNMHMYMHMHTRCQGKMCMPVPKKERSPQAERILRLRNSLKLDQKAFAERLGVDQGTVSRWESGKAKPTTRIYYQFAKLAPRNSELQRDLIEDSDAKNKGDLRYMANGSMSIPDWDKELLSAVIQAAVRKFDVTTGTLTQQEFAEKVIFYYELCHKMKTEDPAMAERFLRSA